MTILAPATSPDGWDDRELLDAIDWDALEPTTAELAAIEADADEDAAQERAFAELVSRLAPCAVRRTRRRRSGRRGPGRVVRAGVAR